MRWTNCSLIFVIGFFFLFSNSCSYIDLDFNNTSTFEIEIDSTTFAIIGDYGEAGEPALKVSELVKTWSPDFILTLGDNNYPDGKLKTIQANISDYYGDFIYNLDAPDGYRCTGRANDEEKNRFFPSIGNHDYYNSNSIQPYLSFFSLPEKETYYEFKWGPVHFFALNSGRNGEANCCDSEQAVWLKEKLAHSISPFKIVYFHHPPYSTSKHGSTESMRWPFKEWGASAVFSGHEHNYQRITRQDDPSFPYIINGLGGRSSFYKCDVNPLDNSIFDTFCYNSTFGAIRSIATKEKLIIQFFSISEPTVPVDEFIILR